MLCPWVVFADYLSAGFLEGALLEGTLLEGTIQEDTLQEGTLQTGCPPRGYCEGAVELRFGHEGASQWATIIRLQRAPGRGASNGDGLGVQFLKIGGQIWGPFLGKSLP